MPRHIGASVGGECPAGSFMHILSFPPTRPEMFWDLRGHPSNSLAGNPGSLYIPTGFNKPDASLVLLVGAALRGGLGGNEHVALALRNSGQLVQEFLGVSSNEW